MTILNKAGESYSPIVGVWKKQDNVYAPTVGVFSKQAGEYQSISSGGGSDPSVVSGRVAVLDAKLYTSGQIWTNSQTGPADGSLITAYDYNLGASNAASSDDPTITDPGTDLAYWAFDGGDYFTHTLAAAAMPEFMRKLHHTGKQFSIELWMRWAGVPAGSIAPLFDSGTSDQGGADMSRGVIFCDLSDYAGTGGRLKLRVNRDAGGAQAINVVSDVGIPSGSIQMLGVSYVANGSSFFYNNGNYMKVAGADTFTATLNTPGSLDAANRARIGARGDGADKVPSGTRLYLVRVYNRALTKAEFDQNWTATKLRFGL